MVNKVEGSIPNVDFPASSREEIKDKSNDSMKGIKIKIALSILVF